ncbi:hypothetical protein ADK38_02755 [Streptomyces varsoviensis]|uniref:Uncharacterized protein n=1 Tax=Streptomyces varsoviensis TaxID=67373 RepID=A0ABR5JDS8_9ACTN|nr:hypothetical protein ADK38_02755 [Streptomyces varsoviensis]
MERHTKVVGQRPAGFGGGVDRGSTAPALVDGRQVPLPLWGIQDRDQDNEPVVHGIAVPQRLHRRHAAWESRGASGK